MAYRRFGHFLFQCILPNFILTDPPIDDSHCSYSIANRMPLG
jgi:hypothetical protein